MLDRRRGNGLLRKAFAKVTKVAVTPRHRERLVLRTDIRPPSKRSTRKKRAIGSMSLYNNGLIILYFVRFGHGINMTTVSAVKRPDQKEFLRDADS